MTYAQKLEQRLGQLNAEYVRQSRSLFDDHLQKETEIRAELAREEKDQPARHTTWVLVNRESNKPATIYHSEAAPCRRVKKRHHYEVYGESIARFTGLRPCPECWTTPKPKR